MAILAAVPLAALFAMAPAEADGPTLLSPQRLAGFLADGRLTLTVNLPPAPNEPVRGVLSVDLLDDRGAVLGEQHQAVRLGAEASGPSFGFEAPRVPVAQVLVRCRFEKQTISAPLANILLAQAHEIAVRTGREFWPGSRAAIHCEVRGVRTVQEVVPLAGARVVVHLCGSGGKRWEMYRGLTDLRGVAAGLLVVPEVPGGEYTLEVDSRSALGSGKVTQQLTLRSEARVWLLTDKPMYQPGQSIRLRALALSAFDQRPCSGEDLTFEVEDARGNKVFQRSLKTSEYGLAHADFNLAEEVNAGDYLVRARLGQQRVEKVVAVKAYVLPRFKATLTADRSYALPEETFRAEVQADYFFGKPVAGARVRVTTSLRAPEPRMLRTWDGITDARGHATAEVGLSNVQLRTLPRVLGPLAIEAVVTDTAGHVQNVRLELPCAREPIQLTLIPEGSRVVPGLENHIFAVALYPDGRPAVCAVRVWAGKQAGGEPLTRLKTNEAGLAEFRLTPRSEHLRVEALSTQAIALSDGRMEQVSAAPRRLELTAEARSIRGEVAITQANLSAEPWGEGLLLHLDKAIYKSGEGIGVAIGTSAGASPVRIDVVKAGQVVLSRRLDVRDARAACKLELPPNLFGSVEVHASQILSQGVVTHDARVAYVQPASDMRVEMRADRDVYRPSAEGTVHFQVTDTTGRPAVAALGVLAVDEAVYALQEMQPGLETVYFSLQEELHKSPRHFKSADSLEALVRERKLSEARQLAAQALLTSFRPPLPRAWEIDPAIERARQAEQQLRDVGFAILAHGLHSGRFHVFNRIHNRWEFPVGLLEDLVRLHRLNRDALTLPTGSPMILEDLARTERGFTPERLARAVTRHRLRWLEQMLLAEAEKHEAEWTDETRLAIPAAIQDYVQRRYPREQHNFVDSWGRRIVLVRLPARRERPGGEKVLEYYEWISSGPDRTFGTPDDLRLTHWATDQSEAVWWKGEETVLAALPVAVRERGVALAAPGLKYRRPVDFVPGQGMGVLAGMSGRNAGIGGIGGAGGFGGGFGGMPAMNGAQAVPSKPALPAAKIVPTSPNLPELMPPETAAPTRLREYIPETLLWQPALITREDGTAELDVQFADSITTWRLSASASSRSGLLGGTSAPLRVFQDFLIDVDLPVALTQGDEIAVPVVVHNYLKEPQKVSLDLQADDWFMPADGQGLVRRLELKPDEVAVVAFRIRAMKAGRQPLTVQARGGKMSDAVKRWVEVRPDGFPVEQVGGGPLAGSAMHTIVIPETAVPGASRLLVRISPSILSQVLEAADGLLQLPHGCFEQTSSSTYPNVLVLDYLRKSSKASPEVLQRAENYVSAGYQRLLTFEHRGGGFSWFGSGQPVLWLTALGLHEFTDMARVYPVDPAVLARTRAWLLRQQASDGSWSQDGLARTLLLTSYIAWALLEGGSRGPEVQKALAYVRDHIGAATGDYERALAANALAAWDPRDEALRELMQGLESRKQDLGEKGCHFTSQGRSLTHAWGDSLSVETTSLVSLALLRSGLHRESANGALAYLARARGSFGTWGTTQATVLALKALTAVSGSPSQKGSASFTVLVNDREVHKGQVNEANADVLQQLDLTQHLRTGRNDVRIHVEGKAAMTYQVIGRHFEPWKSRPANGSLLELAVDYDRTRLTMNDRLKATATLKYHGHEPTAMVMIELGLPPGFDADPGEFTSLVEAQKVKKFALSPEKVTLYLGHVAADSVQAFAYTLRPRYAVKAKAPNAIAYEYYTPSSRTTAAAVELTVVEAGQ
jgi:hypothetical protein